VPWCVGGSTSATKKTHDPIITLSHSTLASGIVFVLLFSERFKKVNMKKWSWIIILAGAFASCSKHEAATDETVTSLAVNDDVYDSGWEQYANWQKTDSAGFQVYSTSKQIPAITQQVIDKATVITYSKVATSNPAYARFTEPIHLDYYFFPPDTKPLQGHFTGMMYTRGAISV
jgi:hypothetical protein